MRVTLILLLFVAPVWASPCPHPVRHEAVKRLFAKNHPCPSTGKHTAHCPGYVIDHIMPLCACGRDEPSNMQWQTVAESRRKDRLERIQCGIQRHAVIG